ncbi:MAG: hypothetical protein HY516_00825 [Candidatus Aenigmarchaeota archaeon]|nr:hypothetical protein [Candidatus Aenigmarchaeota archaeon]
MATKTPWVEMWDRFEPTAPVMASYMKGEPVSVKTHPTFVMDVTLEPGPDKLPGYEFLTNEFAGSYLVGKCPGGRVHVLGSHNAVVQTYKERGFADVRLGLPVGDAARLGPEFAVAVYVTRPQERGR